MSNNKVDFDEEFGDLLGEFETPKKKPAPQQQVPVEKPVQAPVIDVEASDPDEPKFATFGQKVDSVPIPRFKASKEVKARIAILSENILPLRTHFVDGIGSFVCFDGKCCELEGLARVRYLIPIVQYECDKTGAKCISDNLELKALCLGDEQYSALIDAVTFSGRNVRDVDIIVTCSDDQYQKLTFAADSSSGARWLQFPTKMDIVNKWKANKNKLYLAVARKISAETYLTKKGFLRSAAATPDTQGVPFGDVSDMLDE